MQLLLGNPLLPVDNIHILIMSIIWRRRSCNDIPQGLNIITHNLILLFVWLEFTLNVLLSDLEGFLVGDDQAGLLLFLLVGGGGDLLRLCLNLRQTAVVV